MGIKKNQILYQMKKVKKLLAQPIMKIALLVLVTVISYSNIFANEFAGDDRDFIVNWKLNWSPSNIGEMFGGATPVGHEGVYRPLRGIVYIASYVFFEQEIWGYHLLSILIHVVVTLLVYFLVKELTKSESVAWLAGVFFGVHPIHVEAITNITTAFDEVGIIFFLLSVWLYVKRYGEKRLVQKKFYILSIICGGAAIFWYEIALVLPIMLMIIDVLIYKKKLKE